MSESVEGLLLDRLNGKRKGAGFVTDIVNQFKLQNVNVLNAEYGNRAGLWKVEFNNDVVFAWKTAAAGVKVPDGEWIPADRAGLTIRHSASAKARARW